MKRQTTAQPANAPDRKQHTGIPLALLRFQAGATF